MNLFSEEKQIFRLPDAELIYISNFFSKVEADGYFDTLKTTTDWQEDNIKVFGKVYKQPRLTALFGENNQPYSYSNIAMYPKPFTKELNSIKQKIEAISNETFNTVLLNLYRNGNDSNGWHADNEKELGKHPIIASVTFGEERPFHFKHRRLKEERHKLILQHGSLLLMKGAMQEHWLHQIAKTKKNIGERINLTFRNLVNL
ncbi:MAG: alpha-ketoglutarate-dependent dioxygenase AlkB [Winogradskyella sp.]|uniref:alpha-ketoglutarate-dependent dioxygenase AlkB family protein n=1 Tax=Winogradskyella sp. TaxID=1883156 RepID=UPI00181751ED|nr:alpha-ketoglutarate-dependent dioxygenase AlkB [Winogradskyella sp.]MBT8243691.1 alpha-ketoglutarate-dependent dioxygenase AlkB [Winogradskyella sp.]NNK23976.1 alpha-ketoglutarate-dependent dioxygenase AlkB [Winogradskyella sp.]